MEQQDFESLREQRLVALKEQQQQKEKWLSRGHAEYQELADEKEFFACTKASLNVVCHFYRERFNIYILISYLAMKIMH